MTGFVIGLVGVTTGFSTGFTIGFVGTTAGLLEETATGIGELRTLGTAVGRLETARGLTGAYVGLLMGMWVGLFEKTKVGMTVDNDFGLRVG